MFTGLIETIGVMEARQMRGRAVRLTVRASFKESLPVGSSIAVDGVCQTIVHTDGERFQVEATGETLQRTTLAAWRGPRPVNLERPLTPQTRLDGHLVTGHVDGMARLLNRRIESAGVWLDVASPEELARYLASQGSVALDGVSLTVASADGHTFSVSLVPHTLEHTTLGRKQRGDYLNIEVDLVARYVERLMQAHRRPAGRQEGMDEWV